MQLTTQHLGSTKENTGFRRTVNLADALEHHIPIRSTKVRWCSETRNGVAVRVRVVDHNVRGVVDLDLGRQVGVDLDVLLKIKKQDGEKQRAEPLEGAEVSADPEEVDFAEAGLLLRVVHSVPDRLQNRSEGCNTNTCSD